MEWKIRKVFVLHGIEPKSKEKLDRLLKEGWEPFSVSYSENGEMFYLKKEKNGSV